MAETAHQIAAPPTPQTISHLFGEIVWLMTQSPLHRHFALAELEWMVMPALLLNQFRVFHDNGRPIGAATWAYLSEDAETKISSNFPKLRPDEWKSGDRCWLVDLVAPHATVENRIVAMIIADLSRTALKGVRFKFHKVGGAPGKREIGVIEAR